MSNKESVTEKCKSIYKWFMEVREEFPQVQLQMNGGDLDYQIYFIGNKTIGEDYYVNCWKEVPMLSCNIRRYVGREDYYLDMRLPFRASHGSEDWKMEEEKFKAETRKSFIRAIDDFLIKNI